MVGGAGRDAEVLLPRLLDQYGHLYWVAGVVSMIANYDGIMVGSLIITSSP